MRRFLAIRFRSVIVGRERHKNSFMSKVSMSPEYMIVSYLASYVAYCSFVLGILNGQSTPRETNCIRSPSSTLNPSRPCNLKQK